MNAGAHIALLGQANSVHLQRWAIALHERGRRVSVLSQQVQDALPLPPGISFQPLPYRDRLGYLRNAAFLRRWLHQHRPQLLHAHYASGYGTTAMLSGFHPLLLSVWGSDVYDFPLEGRIQAWLLRRNLQAADALASTSAAMAGQVRRLWSAAGPIAVTPFGVDMSCFSPAEPAAGPLTVGTVKTLAHKYGIDTLLRAFAQVGPALGARLLIVGDGPQREQLQALAVELGIAQWVEWAGAVPHAEVPRWLQRLHVYVAASRLDSESFGVAVVEAMACGLPVVVSDAGGLPEVLGPGDGGLTVPRDDPAALARALHRLLDNAVLRRSMGLAARARAEAEYAWPQCVSRMMATQDAVINRYQAVRSGSIVAP